jgi:hypothetical protein
MTVTRRGGLVSVLKGEVNTKSHSTGGVRSTKTQHVNVWETTGETLGTITFRVAVIKLLLLLDCP